MSYRRTLKREVARCQSRLASRKKKKTGVWSKASEGLAAVRGAIGALAQRQY